MSNQYMALYRKYRPGVFSDVSGQEHITKILKSEVMSDTVSHAYLFCGTRGTGKTTCAKILAKAVSCENPVDGDPCGVCDKCRAYDNSFDIVEMDAASNNGVDHVRELREKINFLPIEMKRRVYIIDEVHMLSVGAFNALLKTLEEPPEHVMFILATTELNKIPATILSRCKRFDFRRINADDITKRLEYVSQNEGIGIDRDALRLIATLATGAMRDALSMLELFVGREGITREIAEKTLGVAGNETVLKLITAIAKKDAKSALEIITEAYNVGKESRIICSELGEMFRNLLVMKYAGKSVSTLLDLTSDVVETLRNTEDDFTTERLLYAVEVVEDTVSRLSRTALSSRTVLELMAMRLCDSRLSAAPEALLERISALETNGVAVKQTKNVPEQAKKVEKPSEDIPPSLEDAPPFDLDIPYDIPPEPVVNAPAVEKPKKEEKKAPKSENGLSPMIAFGDVLEEVKAKNMMLYSFVQNARAYLDKDTVTIKADAMACFMIEADENMKQILKECFDKILGYSVSVVIEQAEDDGKSSNTSDFPIF